MPGEAAIFSELTVILMYGNPKDGKTTLTKYITDTKGFSISMDLISLKTFDEFHGITKEVMAENVELDIGRVIDRLSNNIIITNSIIENTMNELSILLEKYKDAKLIVIEGYTLSKENILKKLIDLFKSKKIRHWVCHK
jgi:hypothetical protein